MIGAFNKLFRNAASLKGKGIFDKRLIKASYSGDMKEPKEKHVLFLLECLKGKHLELIRPKEALRKLSDRFFNNLKSLSLMIKALIILHRALQEEEISQTVAHKIKEMENILQPCQNDDQSYDMKMQCFISDLYINYIKNLINFIIISQLFQINLKDLHHYSRNLKLIELFLIFSRIDILIECILKVFQQKAYCQNYRLFHSVIYLLFVDLLKIYQSYYLLVSVMLEKFEQMDLKDSKRAFIIYLNFIKVNREIRKMAAVIVQEFNISLKFHFYEIDAKVAEALKQSIETREKKLRKQGEGEGSQSSNSHENDNNGSPIGALKMSIDRIEFLTEHKKERRKTQNLDIIEMQGNQGGQMMMAQKKFVDYENDQNYENLARTATIDFNRVVPNHKSSQQNTQSDHFSGTIQRSVTMGFTEQQLKQLQQKNKNTQQKNKKNQQKPQIQSYEHQRCQIKNNLEKQFKNNEKILQKYMKSYDSDSNNEQFQTLRNSTDKQQLEINIPVQGQIQGMINNNVQKNNNLLSQDRLKENFQSNSSNRIQESQQYIQDQTFGPTQQQQYYSVNRNKERDHSNNKYRTPIQYTNSNNSNNKNQIDSDDDEDAYKTVFQEDPRFAGYKPSNDDRYNSLFKTANQTTPSQFTSQFQSVNKNNDKEYDTKRKSINPYAINDEQSPINKPSKESFFFDISDSFVMQKQSARNSNALPQQIQNQQQFNDNQIGFQASNNLGLIQPNNPIFINQNIFYGDIRSSKFSNKQDDISDNDEFQDAQDF